MKRIFLTLVLCTIAIPVFAQNATTIGTLTLTPTFDNIGVKFTYTGDANSNNTAVLQYRIQGTSTWLDAHTSAYALIGTSWPDRRATFTGNGGGSISNTPNQNQFRASIVGLVNGATYNIQLTISDADGVTGTNPATGNVTMLSTSTLAPQSGVTKYLDTNAAGGGDGSSGTPYNTFANAITGTSCGDTLIIKATSGASAAPFITRSCSTSNWFQIQCADQSVVAFSEGAGHGGDGNVVLSFSAAVGIKVYNCRIGTSTLTEIEVLSSSHDLWFDNNYFVDMNTSVPSQDCGGNYYQGAIKIVGGAGGITITNNSFNESGVHAPCNVPNSNDHSTSGGGRVIMWNGSSTAGRYIVKNNTITGAWSDCIGQTPEDETNIFDDSDIIGNTITSGSCYDDSIQFEGHNNNVRIGNNIITTATTGYTCLAFQSSFVGPIYIYRNYCNYNGPANGMKIGGTENSYWFHNTEKNTSVAGGVYCWDSSGGSGNIQYMAAVNNICQTVAGAIYADVHSLGTTLDYNILYRSNAGDYVETWNGTTNYGSLAAFVAGTGQDSHSISGNPNLDASLHIDSGSNAYNHGIAIPNFNDATSCWPSSGNPDMGVYEVGVVFGVCTNIINGPGNRGKGKMLLKGKLELMESMK